MPAQAQITIRKGSQIGRQRQSHLDSGSSLSRRRVQVKRQTLKSVLPRIHLLGVVYSILSSFAAMGHRSTNRAKSNPSIDEYKTEKTPRLVLLDATCYPDRLAIYVGSCSILQYKSIAKKITNFGTRKPKKNKKTRDMIRNHKRRRVVALG
ncbi:hypothetical protein F5X98DRAFT_242231 [Xylaria grammica]|nr:hypothetical protein F5X98DRAFT_242231 [Xylaria grammica]